MADKDLHGGSGDDLLFFSKGYGNNDSADAVTIDQIDLSEQDSAPLIGINLNEQKDCFFF